MTSQTRTASATLEPPVEDLGIKVHNLVLTKDSGNDYAEFRVQCEIRLPKPDKENSPEEVQKARQDADKVLVALTNPTPDSIREVKQLVSPYIHDEASDNFKRAVENAFLDYIQLLEKRQRRQG